MTGVAITQISYLTDVLKDHDELSDFDIDSIWDIYESWAQAQYKFLLHCLFSNKWAMLRKHLLELGVKHDHIDTELPEDIACA